MLEKLQAAIQAGAQPESDRDALISYKALRKAIGWIGILIPVVLIWGSYQFSECRQVQPSISHYYYTNVRELFVGAISGVALFLFCYKGCSRLDSRCANFAGFFGLIVALFPTDITCIKKDIGGNCSAYYPCQHDLVSFTSVPYHGTIHLVAAALFFLTLAFMSIALFTLSNEPPVLRTPQKRNRNRIYRVCGWTMVGSIVCIGIYFATGKKETENQFTLIFETIALLAFGFSWLTKGEAIFGDRREAKTTPISRNS